MRSIVWMMILLVPGVGVCAQQDSMLRALNGLPQDTSRLPVLTELLRAAVYNAPDSALHFAAQYRAIAEASGFPLEIGKGHNYTGMCYTMKSEHELALKSYLLALPHFEEGGDPWYTAMAHNNIGSVHEKLQNLTKAREEYEMALDLFKAIPDTVWVANVSNNLGNVYYADGFLDSAVVCYDRANTLLTGSGMGMYSGPTRMNLANALGDLGKNREALEMMRSARAVMPDGEDENTRANILANLGRLHGLVGDPDSAILLMRQGLSLATMTRARSVQASAHEFLSAFFEERGHLDSALFHHKRWAAVNDSIFNEESSAQVAEMQEKYESGKKDVLLAENKAQLERRSITIRTIALGAVLLLLVALLAMRAYRIKRRSEAELERQNSIIQEQLKDKELLLREIHHRVKNNLQTVSSLLSIQGRGIADERAKQAVNDSRLRVKSMALIHQDLYREGDLTGVRMKDYVDKLAKSLIASYDRTDTVDLQCDVQDLSLDVDTAVPLGLILNELITNALKYAWPDGRTGTLTIAMHIADPDGHHRSSRGVDPTDRQGTEVLVLRVRDNGIGYATSSTRSAASSGFGLGMIDTFASKLKAERSIRNENGTLVELIVRNFKLAR